VLAKDPELLADPVALLIVDFRIRRWPLAAPRMISSFFFI
jgi:hypothetical protein